MAKRLNVEYVSANPTGPLHIGHCRGAVFGDVLSSLYTKTGFDVTREYYVNDAGSQINKLSNSLLKRYLQLFDKKIELEKSENLIRVIINSNNIQLISKLYDYSQRINLVQTREFFDREQYLRLILMT